MADMEPPPLFGEDNEASDSSHNDDDDLFASAIEVISVVCYITSVVINVNYVMITSLQNYNFRLFFIFFAIIKIVYK